MRILITNQSMYRMGGTETYVYTLTKELVNRGHEVEIWTKEPGLVSNLITKEFGCVVNFVKKEYDLILINHNFMAKRVIELGIKGTKIQTCHGIFVDEEQPYPGLDAYVSISQEVHDNLKHKGFDSTIIYNGVDCNKFTPSNGDETTVYSLSQNAGLNRRLEMICKSIGHKFKSNNKFKNPTLDTTKEIQSASVVISLGRGAYEAMACGKPVIVLDHRPYSNYHADGLITKENITEVMKHNCSGRRYQYQPSDEEIKYWIMNASPFIGRDMREIALKEFNISKQVDKYLELYDTVTPFYEAIVYDEHPEVFGDVALMLNSLYAKKQEYNNCVIWLGYNLRHINELKKQYPDKKIIIFQMEQLFDGSPYNNKFIIENLNLADEIWEYDTENLKWLKDNLNIDAIHRPLLYAPELKQINRKQFMEHDIDVLFYGFPNQRRLKIIEDICKKLWRKNISVVTLYNCFGDKLKDFISRSKIVVNIHFYETSRQEQARLFYLLANGKCIVSEPSPETHLTPLIHEVPYENIAKKCETLIQSNQWWQDTISTEDKYKELSNSLLETKKDSE